MIGLRLLAGSIGDGALAFAACAFVYALARAQGCSDAEVAAAAFVALVASNVGLIALNRGDEFRMHVRAAFNNGVTREEMKELFLHAALYCGLPAANQAIHDAEKVFAEMEAANPGSTTRARDGAQG